MDWMLHLSIGRFVECILDRHFLPVFIWIINKLSIFTFFGIKTLWGWIYTHFHIIARPWFTLCCMHLAPLQSLSLNPYCLALVLLPSLLSLKLPFEKVKWVVDGVFILPLPTTALNVRTKRRGKWETVKSTTTIVTPHHSACIVVASLPASVAAVATVAAPLRIALPNPPAHPPAATTGAVDLVSYAVAPRLWMLLAPVRVSLLAHIVVLHADWARLYVMLVSHYCFVLSFAVFNVSPIFIVNPKTLDYRILAQKVRSLQLLVVYSWRGHGFRTTALGYVCDGGFIAVPVPWFLTHPHYRS